ncbi:hypothetical protein QFC21_007144 [Naganishia friedmannii]|uniref:Uncharacterized protein n=1 Tax=Naganishia friedmannii TaxID=89922 RepID=A0ACC2UXW9_9TREE|nr:hypothetical protein QFC21_007144 [Naganishia friedmannii]
MTPFQPITINGNTLDAGRGTALSFGDFADDAKGTNYIVVQTSKEALEDADYKVLDSHGVELTDLVSDQTYLCRFKGTDLDTLRQLDFVSFVDTYKDAFVIHASLKQQAPTHQPLDAQGQQAGVSNSVETVKVDIVLHVDSTGEDENVKQEIVSRTGVEPSTITIINKNLRATLPYASLVKVAKIDLVQAILPAHAVTLMIDRHSSSGE